MNSYDFDAVFFDGECYCIECLPDEIYVDDTEVDPIFADTELDFYPVCCICGRKHEYCGLTIDGVENEGLDNDGNLFDRIEN